jgi:hypothetical protein
MTDNTKSLLHAPGKLRLLERLGKVRGAPAKALGEYWSHAAFLAQRTHIEQQLDGGELQAAFDGAQSLLERARAASERADPEPDYDLAMACWLPARGVVDRRQIGARPAAAQGGA